MKIRNVNSWVYVSQHESDGWEGESQDAGKRMLDELKFMEKELSQCSRQWKGQGWS